MIIFGPGPGAMSFAYLISGRDVFVLLSEGVLEMHPLTGWKQRVEGKKLKSRLFLFNSKKQFQALVPSR